MRSLLLIACTVATFHSFANFQAKDEVKKENREVSDFSSIILSGSMNVKLSYGANAVSVEADESILPYVVTEVKDGTLIIKTKNKTSFKSMHGIIVYVSMKNISSLNISGSGNITGSGNFSSSDKLSLGVSGSGDINLGVERLNEVNIAISGSGNVNLKGETTNNIDASISGSGNIDASNLACNDVFAKVSGSGNIRVNVSKSIDAKVVGSGNIYYKGAATRISMKSVGSGKIIKV